MHVVGRIQQTCSVDFLASIVVISYRIVLFCSEHMPVHPRHEDRGSGVAPILSW